MTGFASCATRPVVFMFLSNCGKLLLETSSLMRLSFWRRLLVDDMSMFALRMVRLLVVVAALVLVVQTSCSYRTHLSDSW
ncbi:MAG: hypothetical protein OK474_04295 [Thaumarchaeota archaeon]|nr:hypothetical protein [Nitrososphaerota archaeon]